MQNSSFHLESFPFTALHGPWDPSITLSHCIDLRCMSLCWRVSELYVCTAIGIHLWKWFPTSSMWDTATEASHLATSTFTYSAVSPAPTAFSISQNYLAYVLYITYKDFSYILFFHMEIYHEFISLEKERSYDFNWDHIEFNWRILLSYPSNGL